jgi:hypothetical protein
MTPNSIGLASAAVSAFHPKCALVTSGSIPEFSTWLLWLTLEVAHADQAIYILVAVFKNASKQQQYR